MENKEGEMTFSDFMSFFFKGLKFTLLVWIILFAIVGMFAVHNPCPCMEDAQIEISSD